MPIVPVRNLAQFGIITDVDSYDLPATAWSAGVNVRFRNRKIERGPVHRDVDTLQADIRYMAISSPSTGFDTMFLGYLNGRVFEWDNSIETDRSVAGFVNNSDESIYTSAFLSDVFYINRADRVPWALGPTASQFVNLTGWDSTHRAKLMRSLSGALVALGVTKGATEFPTMVKTSSFALAGQQPASWDHTIPSTNATENVLAEMEGYIIDANSFRDSLIIYSRYETWAMQLVPGSDDIFSYRRVFDDAGSINTNCSIEIDGKHYVFGTDDIWRHDGVSKESICDERTRLFIFNSLNYKASNRCFVFHDAPKGELHFFYVSADPLVKFAPDPAKGANRSAVYNYVNETWSFDDHPYVFNADLSNVDTTSTWVTVTQTWSEIGGSWANQEDSFEKVAVMVCGDLGNGVKLTAFDHQGPNSSVGAPIYATGNGSAQLIREGIDLDEIGAELRGYKVMDSLYPQGRLETGALPLEFAFGSADFPNSQIFYTDWQTYDGGPFYKLDYRAAGRYLAMKIRQTDFSWFSFSGFDFDLDVLSDK